MRPASARGPRRHRRNHRADERHHPNAACRPRCLARRTPAGDDVKKAVAPFAPIDTTPEEFRLSDNGNAEYFEREVDHRLAFDHASRQWFEFEGHHWRVGSVQHVIERAMGAMRQRGRDADLIADSARRRAALLWALK